MAATEYLLDTCAYFRLSQTLVPILGLDLGRPPIKLKLIPDFHKEFEKNPRLTNKFFWASIEPHTSDQKKGQLRLNQARKKQIDNTYQFMASEARDKKLQTSYIDMRSAAIGLEYDIPIVTDDKDLRKLIEEFAENRFKWVSTIEILHLLMTNGHLDIGRVEAVVTYWMMNNDVPSGTWHLDYKAFFNREIPEV